VALALLLPRFVSEGAKVFIFGRRQNEIDRGVSEIGKNVIGIQGDVTNLADLDRLFDVVKDQKSHLDILFANAGIAQFAPLGEISEEHFDKIFHLNVKGLLFTVQKALPILEDGGSIILNASIGSSKGVGGGLVFTVRPRLPYVPLRERGLSI
jgi:NAD(P)-dependent dehydrogenase (short-subunit alcohol dehydrogenase family)